MTSYLRALKLALAVMVVASVLAACRGPQGPERLRVVASVFPVADMVRNVGGDLVQVSTLLPPGVDIHTYEPTVGRVKDLAQAKLFIKIGAGLEFWADKLVSASGNPDLVVVDTSNGVSLLEEVGEGRANPHYWLDVSLAMKQVGDISAGLAAVDPANRETYERNAAAYLLQLKELDRWVAGTTGAMTSRSFVAFHPTWDYFARRYGLVQEAVIEESPGKEPSPAYIKQVIDTARAKGVKAVFADAQFNPQAAEAIARETGAQVLLLDSLGGVPGRDSYRELVRYNVSLMSLAMR